MTRSSEKSETDSRVMLLTPAGVGAIAVVRVVGPKVEAFLLSHFSRKTAVGRLSHGHLIDGDQVVDDPVVARVSKTIADLNMHGGSWVIRRVIDLAISAGFRQVDASTHLLPLDAVDSIEEIEREVEMALPFARTEATVRRLLAQPSAWRRLLKEPIDRSAVEGVMTDRSMYWMLHPPTVAIVGPPNVGKSTLANQLFGVERSITADVPGTTRDWVGEIADVGGLAVTLVDTPGVRRSSDAIEMAAIELAGRKVLEADAVIVVADARNLEDYTVRSLREKYPEAMRVANRIDLAGDLKEGWVGTCAVDGQGVEQVREAIRGRFGCAVVDGGRVGWWTEVQQARLRGLVD